MYAVAGVSPVDVSCASMSISSWTPRQICDPPEGSLYIADLVAKIITPTVMNFVNERLKL